MIDVGLTWIAMRMFELTGGIAIMGSFWISIIWIVLGVFLLYIPILLPIWMNSKVLREYSLILFVIAFIPIIALILGPPIIQDQMLFECENIYVVVKTVKSEYQRDMRECREKDNLYSEFGEWKLYSTIE